MPHHSIHYTSAGLQQLAGQDKPLGDFASDLEQIVATVFNDLLGESLVPGQTVITDAMVPTSSMPVDFHLTCTAWTTPARSTQEATLQVKLREKLARYFKDHFTGQLPTWDAHLNIVRPST